MKSSESGVILSFFAVLVTLTLIASYTPLTEATAWPQILKSKGGAALPLKGHDIEQPWCRMKPLPQTVRRRGCEAKTVINNMCYGQCRSFYVPLGKKSFEACAFCTPVNSTTVSVVLNCPSRTKKQVVKKVQIISACSCRACGQKYISNKGNQ